MNTFNYIEQEIPEQKNNCNQCKSKNNLKQYTFNTDSIFFKLFFTLCKSCSKKDYVIHNSKLILSTKWFKGAK